jgi:hypothetical protein
MMHPVTPEREMAWLRLVESGVIEETWWLQVGETTYGRENSAASSLGSTSEVHRRRVKVMECLQTPNRQADESDFGRLRSHESST